MNIFWFINTSSIYQFFFFLILNKHLHIKVSNIFVNIFYELEVYCINLHTFLNSYILTFFNFNLTPVKYRKIF